MPLAFVNLRRGGYSLVLLGLLCTGCAGPNYSAARADFYAGRLTSAEERLAEPPGRRNAVLFLMERGTVLQAAGRYEDSADDWLQAVALARRLAPHSVSEQGTSMLVNDNAISFRGKPFERTLLRSFLAKSFMARGMWQDAGVEARNVIHNLQRLDGYPDDAYSRYMAGFCLELLNDPSNARLQYRRADDLCAGIVIDRMGQVRPGKKDDSPEGTTSADSASPAHELVCFIAIGRSPTGRQAVYSPIYIPAVPPHAEIYANGKYLGRSYPLTDTGHLVNQTRQKEAAAQLAKDVARIAAKSAITHQVSQQDPALGMLAELLLFGSERPDMRRWETLPRWLQVARVPCPPDLDGFDVVFKGSRGGTFRTVTVPGPIPQKGEIFVSFCRDLPSRPASSRPPAAGDSPGPVKTP